MSKTLFSAWYLWLKLSNAGCRRATKSYRGSTILPPYLDVLTYPAIALFSFRASSETDSVPVSTIVSSSPTSKPSVTSPVPGSTPSQQPPAPTIHSYLLPHSQGVHHPSSSGKPYVPSKCVQTLTQYPSSGGPGSAGAGGTSGGPTSHITSPTADRLLDDDADGANERWSDRFSFVAKDSYGNLRYVFPPSVFSVRSLTRDSSFIGGASSMMFVEALNSLNDPAPLAGSPASSSSDRMQKATVEAELPFFKPNYQFRRVSTMWVSSQTGALYTHSGSL